MGCTAIGVPNMSEEQWELANLISDISNDHQFAGWMGDIEYSLWKMVVNVGASRHYGFGSVKEHRIDRLYDLANKLQGWVYWNEDCGETFVTLDTWREMYDNYVNTNGA